jgi:hypothetical protein
MADMGTVEKLASAGLMAALAGCAGGAAVTPTETMRPNPTLASPPTEIAPLPTGSPTPEASATPKVEKTATPVAVSSEPYPTGDGGLILNAGGPENSESRLVELGAGEDIAIQKELLYAQLTRQGKNIADFNYVVKLNERLDNPKLSSWTMMMQEKSTGRYYRPILSTGPDAGKGIRSGNLYQYENKSPVIKFFDLVPVENPKGLGEVEQKLVSTDSGWWTIAFFSKTNGKALSWLDIDKSDVADYYAPAAGLIPADMAALPVQNEKTGEWQVVNIQNQILTYDPKGGEWVAPVDEHELQPAYTETVDQEFMGVHIHAELVTDQSLAPTIKEVKMGEAAYTEFIARTIYKAWQAKRPGPETEEGFKSYIALWAKAQASGLQADWDQVALTIFANDLNDGNGYKVKQEKIWPMYSGQTPDGVRGIDSITIALVNGTKVKNNTVVSESELSYGTNLDNNMLLIYYGLYYGGNFPNLAENVAQGATGIGNWIANGRSGSSINKSLQNVLLNGGLKVN